MIKEAIGTILTYNGTPSIDKAYFQLNKGVIIKAGKFVSIDHDNEHIFGMITGISRVNPFFEQLHTDYDNLKDKFPTEEWHKTLVEVKLLGSVEGKHSVRTQNPPFSGAYVHFAKPEEIRTFLGFTEEGLYLGDIDTESKKVEVKINMSKLLQKHLAILAMSGAGKSHFVSILLEELLNIPEEQGPLGIVLFDVHGEYKSSFAEPSNKEYVSYHNKTRYFDGNNMKFAMHSLKDSFLFKFLGGISDTQQRELLRILKEFKGTDDKKVFDFKDIIQHIEESNLKVNVKEPLLGWLNLAESQNIFAKTSTFNIFKIVEPGKLTIIDLSDVLDYSRKQIIVAYISDKLFELRRNNKIPPFLIVLEEAHQFIPQSGSAEYMKARHIFETIVREGRKFGAALCLVSQRPNNLSTTVLSQCNTHLLLRIINPNDLKYIAESSEGLDSSSIAIIPGLDVGEALLVGSCVKFPVFFKVRERKSQPNKYDLDLHQMSKNFTEKQETKDKDLELYL